MRTTSALIGLLAATMLTTPSSADTLRWARAMDALTLDPHSQNEGPTHTMSGHIYEPLVRRGGDGSLVPILATDWYVLESDPDVWVFELRSNVTFHDGAPFSADDVVFSLNRAMSDFSGSKPYLAAVEEVSKADDLTVHVRMTGPSPIFPNNLTNVFIMNRAWSEANNVVEPQDFAGGRDSFAARNANGTGRYRLVSRDPDVRTVLEFNDGHWSESEPDVTEVIYLPITDAATRIAALLSGEVDLVQDVPVQDIARLSNAPGLHVESGPENRIIYFAYDVGSPALASSNLEDDNPFLNVKVREAMALALDRDAIRDVVMRGHSLPTGVAVPPFVDGWTEELDGYPAPDYERARALMDEAGYGDGFSVVLDCPNDRYINDEAICTAYVGMLGRIGIDVLLNAQSRTIVFPMIENWETDFYLFGAGVPTFDSGYLFDVLYHTREGPYGTYNGSRLNDREIDAKIESLATDLDSARRHATMVEIWTKLKEEFLVLPVHNQLLSYAMREGIQLPVHPENQPNMADVTIAN